MQLEPALLPLPLPSPPYRRSLIIFPDLFTGIICDWGWHTSCKSGVFSIPFRTTEISLYLWARDTTELLVRVQHPLFPMPRLPRTTNARELPLSLLSASPEWEVPGKEKCCTLPIWSLPSQHTATRASPVYVQSLGVPRCWWPLGDLDLMFGERKVVWVSQEYGKQSEGGRRKSRRQLLFLLVYYYPIKLLLLDLSFTYLWRYDYVKGAESKITRKWYEWVSASSGQCSVLWIHITA